MCTSLAASTSRESKRRRLWAVEQVSTMYKSGARQAVQRGLKASHLETQNACSDHTERDAEIPSELALFRFARRRSWIRAPSSPPAYHQVTALIHSLWLGAKTPACHNRALRRDPQVCVDPSGLFRRSRHRGPSEPSAPWWWPGRCSERGGSVAKVVETKTFATDRPRCGPPEASVEVAAAEIATRRGGEDDAIRGRLGEGVEMLGERLHEQRR
jgi:hypothetical protein